METKATPEFEPHKPGVVDAGNLELIGSVRVRCAVGDELCDSVGEAVDGRVLR